MRPGLRRFPEPSIGTAGMIIDVLRTKNAG
jgi:hypothetical protein